MQYNLEWLESYSENITFCNYRFILSALQTVRFIRTDDTDHYGNGPHSLTKLALYKSTSDQRDERKEKNADFLRSVGPSE